MDKVAVEALLNADNKDTQGKMKSMIYVALISYLLPTNKNKNKTKKRTIKLIEPE